MSLQIASSNFMSFLDRVLPPLGGGLSVLVFLIFLVALRLVKGRSPSRSQR